MTGARGEVTIDVPGDDPVTVLFTNRALADAERATGKTVLELASGARDGRLGVGDTAHLLHVGMEAARRDARVGGRSYTLNDAYGVLDRVGFAAALAAVMEAIASVLSFDPNDKEDEAVPPA